MRCFLDRRFSGESAVLANTAMRRIPFEDTQLRRDGGAPTAASGSLLILEPRHPLWYQQQREDLSNGSRIRPNVALRPLTGDDEVMTSDESRWALIRPRVITISLSADTMPGTVSRPSEQSSDKPESDLKNQGS